MGRLDENERKRKQTAKECHSITQFFSPAQKASKLDNENLTTETDSEQSASEDTNDETETEKADVEHQINKPGIYISCFCNIKPVIFMFRTFCIYNVKVTYTVGGPSPPFNPLATPLHPHITFN